MASNTLTGRVRPASRCPLPAGLARRVAALPGARETLLALVLAGLAPALAAQPDPACERINRPALPDFDFTESISRWGTREAFDLGDQDYHVQSVRISQLPIFDETDPKENNALYHWINRVHFDTQPEVIREQLLFDNQDVISAEALAESERILRNRAYVADAKVRVLEKCDDNLNLEVVTREVWTLSPEVAFRSAGGESTTRVGLRDTNFLGSGQQLSVLYKNDSERSSYEFAYKNPNLNGSRIVLDAGAADNSDGHRYFAHAGLPFYALDSRFSWNGSVESVDEILSQYSLGKKSTFVDHQLRLAELSWGLSSGRETRGFIKRFSLGGHYEQHRYAPVAAVAAPAAFPDDLTLSYPFVRFEAVEDAYAVAYNISQIYRTEDLHVGKYFYSTLGYDPGGSDNVTVKGAYYDTLLFKPKQLLQFHADWDGRWNTHAGQWRDSIVSASLDFHRGQTDNRTLYMGLAATKALHLNNGRQISLGGDNGLRGFDHRLLNGDGSLEFTVEQRLFTNYHILQLVRVGFAAFFDAGRIYGDPNPAADGLFKNVGVGLRLAPSKSNKGRILHIDLAWPLGNNPTGKSTGLVMELKESF